MLLGLPLVERLFPRNEERADKTFTGEDAVDMDKVWVLVGGERWNGVGELKPEGVILDVRLVVDVHRRTVGDGAPEEPIGVMFFSDVVGNENGSAFSVVDVEARMLGASTFEVAVSLEPSGHGPGTDCFLWVCIVPQIGGLVDGPVTSERAIIKEFVLPAARSFSDD